MIHEIAELTITAGAEAAFEAAVAEAAQYFKASKGCRSLKLHRCIESPQMYRLVVGWDSVDDHMVTFRESEGFTQWRALAGPHFSEPPKVIHLEQVLEAF